jgi:oxygen-dependent protoporphyrinogen oxidase
MINKKVIVIGGGVAGLAAARTLNTQGFSVSVLEQQQTLGGRVGTFDVDGMTINKGARLLYSFSPALNALLGELSLTDQFYRHSQLSANCVGVNKDWPIHLMPSVKSAFIPDLGIGERIRLARHAAQLWQLRKRANPDDAASVPEADRQTLADFALKKVGPNFLKNVLEPLFGGARSWSPQDISAAFYLTTSPHMFGAKVMHPHKGMGALPEALSVGLEVETGVQVKAIVEGQRCQVVSETAGQEIVHEADYVVCAVPGDLVPTMVDNIDEGDRSFFEQVHYTAYGAVHALLKGHLEEKMSFFDCDAARGVSVYQQDPKAEHTQIYVQLDPASVALARSKGMQDQLDTLMADRMHELCPALLDGGVATYNQWIERMLPLFPPGYCAKMRAFRDRQAKSPRRVYYCGDYLAQALVNGAVASGQTAAHTLSRHWS